MRMDVVSAKDANGNEIPPERCNARAFNGQIEYDKLCGVHLERFKNNAKGLHDIPQDLSDDEWWALGRHHGLVTPLLDWTDSLYIAAFFALSDIYRKIVFSSGMSLINMVGSSCVWELQVHSDLFIENEFRCIRTPAFIGTRQRNQRGLFTRLDNSEFIDLVPYLTDRGSAHYLVRHELPHKMIVDAFLDLQAMNINFLTMFPDLEGAALQANVDEERLRLESWFH